MSAFCARCLILNVVILIGYALEEAVAETGVKLPLFVICLLVGIVATNIVPRFFPDIEWPTRTRALALISDLSLNVFLAMSLMSMQLWTLGGLGPALVVGAGGPDDRGGRLHRLCRLPGDGPRLSGRRDLGRIHRRQPRARTRRRPRSCASHHAAGLGRRLRSGGTGDALRVFRPSSSLGRGGGSPAVLHFDHLANARRAIGWGRGKFVNRAAVVEVVKNGC